MIEATHAIGIVSKSGRYGGTYADNKIIKGEIMNKNTKSKKLIKNTQWMDEDDIIEYLETSEIFTDTYRKEMLPLMQKFLYDLKFPENYLYRISTDSKNKNIYTKYKITENVMAETTINYQRLIIESEMMEGQELIDEIEDMPMLTQAFKKVLVLRIAKEMKNLKFPENNLYSLCCDGANVAIAYEKKDDNDIGDIFETESEQFKQYQHEKAVEHEKNLH